MARECFHLLQLSLECQESQHINVLVKDKLGVQLLSIKRTDGHYHTIFYCFDSLLYIIFIFTVVFFFIIQCRFG